MSMWYKLRVLSRSLSTRVSNPNVLNIKTTKTTTDLRETITNKTEVTELLNKLSRNQTEVALSIAKRLLTKEGKANNVVFSPLSIHSVLSIVAAGTSKGHALDRMLSFLRFESTDILNSFASHLATTVLSDGKPIGGPLLNFAFGAWLDKSLTPKPSFRQLLPTFYNATLASIDFQSKAEVTKEINSWVEKETNGLIKSIISTESIKMETVLIFANALYFKGLWKEKFDAKRTSCYDFHLLDGTSTKVPFMNSEEKQFISAFNDFKVLGLPYKRGKDKRQFSMYIFLPNTKDGLPALIQKVCSNKSDFLESKLPRVKVAVGDFRDMDSLTSKSSSNVLKDLGFSNGNLTEIVKNTTMLVSDIFHKSIIEVNEEGTEAAAATVVFGELGISIAKKIDFVADHPFLFVIREDTTGSVLFIGQADEARKEINLWAENETNHLIRNILPPGSVDSFTRLILANTLYFKGTWRQKFDASKTKPHDFHVLDGTSVEVPFMTSKGEQFILVFDGFKVPGLPYEQSRDNQRQFSMYLFLPDAKDGLSALAEKITYEPGFLESKLPYKKVEVGHFRIPRFKISFGFEALR
ncbi:hypothetical protein RIF29_12728 [Crotalaria pallida]|uniref:Serpin domain-containing protein n=1 Tax=Crotalaria pallida TaxID=3830 RepID=A0AAN9INQ3_CROPI